MWRRRGPGKVNSGTPRLRYTGSGPLSIVPCSLTRLNFYAQAGADATAFALKGESKPVNIKETHFTAGQPDINACGEK